MRTAELLAIDVAAELHTLCREQLQGSWQVPAELVRLAVVRGARRVEVRGHRRGFELRCDGAELSLRHLAALALALDGEAEGDRRHGAVVELEEGAALALLWAAGFEDGSIEIVADGPGGRFSMRYRTGAPPELVEDPEPRGETGFELRSSSRRFDWGRAVDWLRSAVRFAPLPVVVDGQPVDRGFAAVLAETLLERPVPCSVAVARTGDAPRLWLLRHGVVATRATVPGYPAFEAAVELAAHSTATATPGDLRGAVNRFLPGLTETAVGLMIDAARGIERLDGAARERLVCLLLRAARRRLRRDDIVGLPLLRVASGPPRRTAWMTVSEARQLALRSGGLLLSDDPAAPRAAASEGGRPVLLLSTEAQSLLADLLRVRVERVPRRSRNRGLRSLAAAVRTGLARVSELTLGPVGRAVVPADELLDPERALLTTLNRHLAPPFEARICTGSGRLRRRSGRLLLPRNSTLVVRAARLVAADERWQYPVVLALLGEHATAIEPLRARWLRLILAA